MVEPRTNENRLPVAGIPGKSPVFNRHGPLDNSPLASDKPASQSIFEITYCRKGADREAAKFLFAPGGDAEGNVLENAIVDKKGKNKFRIVGRPGRRPIIEQFF